MAPNRLRAAAASDPHLIPPALATWLSVFRSCFTAPVWNRVLVLVAGAVLVLGPTGGEAKVEIDAAYVVFNEFKSVIAQRLIVEQILPIEQIGEQAVRLAAVMRLVIEEMHQDISENLRLGHS